MDNTSEHVSNNKSRQTLIFVYGTLKRGLSNHWLMTNPIARDDAVFLGNYVTIQPYLLVHEGVPHLINLPGRGRRVRGEIYSFRDRGLAPLDELEGVAVGRYQRLPIRVVSEAHRGCRGVLLEPEPWGNIVGDQSRQRSERVYGETDRPTGPRSAKRRGRPRRDLRDF